MAETLYREKDSGLGFALLTGTAPITESGLTPATVYEYPKGDGTLGEVTSGAAAPATDTTYTFSGLSNNTLFANAEDPDSATLDLYHTLDTAAIGDVPTPAQVEAGQDHTGSAAQFSQGPDTVSTGVVNVSLPLSSEPEGTYILRGVAKDPDGNYSTVQSQEITIDIPFFDDANRADELLQASADWDNLSGGSASAGRIEVKDQQFQYLYAVDNRSALYETTVEKPANQFIEFDVVALTRNTSNMEMSFYVRRVASATTGGYELFFDPTNGSQGKIFLRGLSGGSIEVSGRPVAGQTYRLEAQGDQIRVRRNGAVILSATDTTYTNGGPAQKGFFFGPSGAVFVTDNFKFGAL